MPNEMEGTEEPRAGLTDQEYAELEGEYRREEDRLWEEDVWNEHFPRR